MGMPSANDAWATGLEAMLVSVRGRGQARGRSGSPSSRGLLLGVLAFRKLFPKEPGRLYLLPVGEPDHIGLARR